MTTFIQQMFADTGVTSLVESNLHILIGIIIVLVIFSVLSFVFRAFKAAIGIAIGAGLLIVFYSFINPMISAFQAGEYDGSLSSFSDKISSVTEVVDSGKSNSSSLTIQEKLDALLSKDSDDENEATAEEAISTITEIEPSIVEGDLVVHFIDVGQADCIFLENGEDTVLIDCGNYADATLVTEYLSGLGIKQIDYFIVTHPHEDHIGCAATILRLFEVDTLIKSEAINTTTCYEVMMEEAEEQMINIDIPEVGDIYQVGDASFQILGPVENDEDELNNCSIVINYVYGETNFIFTGDAEAEEERDILDLGFDLSADVLKVGHHGSSSSSTYAWIYAIMPEYAVICVGEGNDYGHPTEDTLSILEDAEVEVYRTDEDGTIVMISNGLDIEISTEK